MNLDAKNPLTPPNLADLMLRYVNRPIDAASIEAEAGALGEVEPHEVAVGFRTDPRLAWLEGQVAFSSFAVKVGKGVSAPAEWAAVVVRHESVATEPMALGGYPQRVRDLTALLQANDLTSLRPNGESRAASASLRSWADKQVAKNDPQLALLAAAVLRAAGDLDQAGAILSALRNQVAEELRPMYSNEEAALLWQKSECAKAAAIWESLPETPAVLFNRGMALLFLGQAVKAREVFRKAIALIPERDGWHHLASLYLALAEMRN
jgi:tetratricopeptide (TPR) repeat protein